MGKQELDKLLIATFSGITSGIILGLLFAPDKGSKTREKLSRKGDEYLKAITNDIADIRTYLQKRAESTKKELDELGEQSHDKTDEVLKNAKKLISFEEWTKEELYERAKKEQIDGYSQMNKEELIKALKEKSIPLS